MTDTGASPTKAPRDSDQAEPTVTVGRILLSTCLAIGFAAVGAFAIVLSWAIVKLLIEPFIRDPLLLLISYMVTGLVTPILLWALACFVTRGMSSSWRKRIRRTSAIGFIIAIALELAYLVPFLLLGIGFKDVRM